MIFTPFCPPRLLGVPGAFSHACFGRWHRGFYILAVNKQPTIWTVLVTTIMPASPNDQTPRSATGIRLSSPFLDALQAQRANPSKTSEKRTATPKLIPSPEGNTVTAPRRMTCSRAHPRSRGEHTGAPSAARRALGSSPLARGTRLAAVFDCGLVGLIPARAGNTFQCNA